MVLPDMPMLVEADPTRMAQGIMTGIGFLGAGVIFKEGLTVRGLTTAASIWICPNARATASAAAAACAAAKNRFPRRLREAAGPRE